MRDGHPDGDSTRGTCTRAFPEPSRVPRSSASGFSLSATPSPPSSRNPRGRNSNGSHRAADGRVNARSARAVHRSAAPDIPPPARNDPSIDPSRGSPAMSLACSVSTETRNFGRRNSATRKLPATSHESPAAVGWRCSAGRCSFTTETSQLPSGAPVGMASSISAPPHASSAAARTAVSCPRGSRTTNVASRESGTVSPRSCCLRTTALSRTDSPGRTIPRSAQTTPVTGGRSRQSTGRLNSHPRWPSDQSVRAYARSSPTRAVTRNGGSGPRSHGERASPSASVVPSQSNLPCASRTRTTAPGTDRASASRVTHASTPWCRDDFAVSPSEVTCVSARRGSRRLRDSPWSYSLPGTTAVASRTERTTPGFPESTGSRSTGLTTRRSAGASIFRASSI